MKCLLSFLFCCLSLLLLFQAGDAASAKKKIYGNQDYYQILGVEREATQRQIKKSYFELSKKYHPDVNQGDPDAEQRFIEINQAYEVISDEKKREQYNQLGHDQFLRQAEGGGPGPGGPGGFQFRDPFDIFSQFFGQGGPGDEFGGGGQRFTFNMGGGGGHQQHFHQHHQQQQRPQENYFDNNPDVVELNPNSFFTDVKNKKGGVWMVMFYAPWCKHCKELKPQYEQAAQGFKGSPSVHFGALNCEGESKSICQEFGISGYPTIKLFPLNSKEGPVTFEGSRTPAALIDFVYNSVPSTVKILNQDSLIQFLQNTATARVILFSTKASVPPLFRLLALDFQGKLSLSMVHSSQNDIASQFQVKKFPSVLVLTEDGNQEIYTSSMKLGDLSKHLSRFVKSAQTQQQPQGRTPSSAGKKDIVELSAENSVICDSVICVIFAFKRAPSESQLQSIRDIASRFHNDPLRFVFVDKKKQSDFVKSFSSTSDEFVILLKKSRSRFIIHDDHGSDKLARLLERVLGGEGTWSSTDVAALKFTHG